ncbi:MAG TPA: transposase [Bacteroidota bacterium]|nr:transposase [Bacteroidota bacterium]
MEGAPEGIRAVVEALRGLRRVRKVAAIGVVAEIGQFPRFTHPRQLMGYSGAVPSEFSTGGPGKHQRGSLRRTHAAAGAPCARGGCLDSRMLSRVPPTPRRALP